MASSKNWKSATDDKEKYQLYLSSREWCALREKVRERAGDRCERCEILPMDACHHLSYANKYNEKMEDLQAICTSCHEFTHGKSDFDPLANGDFIHWLSCNLGPKGWLAPGLVTTILRDVFTIPSLLPVFQLWVTVGVADMGAEECIATYAECKDEEGVKVEDVGVIPTPMEFCVLKMLDDEQKEFWHWLRWGGPCEQPIGNRAAHAKCIELAPQANKARRHKSAKLGDF